MGALPETHSSLSKSPELLNRESFNSRFRQGFRPTSLTNVPSNTGAVISRNLVTYIDKFVSLAAAFVAMAFLSSCGGAKAGMPTLAGGSRSVPGYGEGTGSSGDQRGETSVRKPASWRWPLRAIRPIEWHSILRGGQIGQ
jgi:hypothetical protein